MSKATATVEIMLSVDVEIDSDGCLSPQGWRRAKPGANEPFDRDTIRQWLQDEFSLSVNDYETEDMHGYMRVQVDHQQIEDVTIEIFEA